mmetsp:Transcript_27770/g.69599  ORF Transcript_27770/g.69599 Transcript_27770/m.69599 type:complete len:229 (+) Transcript_27770:904-1590(+)
MMWVSIASKSKVPLRDTPPIKVCSSGLYDPNTDCTRFPPKENPTAKMGTSEPHSFRMPRMASRASCTAVFDQVSGRRVVRGAPRPRHPFTAVRNPSRVAKKRRHAPRVKIRAVADDARKNKENGCIFFGSRRNPPVKRNGSSILRGLNNFPFKCKAKHIWHLGWRNPESEHASLYVLIAGPDGGMKLHEKGTVGKKSLHSWRGRVYSWLQRRRLQSGRHSLDKCPWVR